jgi:hypothetical protein
MANALGVDESELNAVHPDPRNLDAAMYRDHRFACIAPMPIDAGDTLVITSDGKSLRTYFVPGPGKWKPEDLPSRGNFSWMPYPENYRLDVVSQSTYEAVLKANPDLAPPTDEELEAMGVSRTEDAIGLARGDI